MRAYSEISEETLRARNLLKDWSGEAFLTQAQYLQLELETVCDLHRTNVFLRIVLFLFTLIIVGAAIGLFFLIFLSHPSRQTAGLLFLLVAAISYGAAEWVVAEHGLYRYGIEEALAMCSLGSLVGGTWLVFFGDSLFPSNADPIRCLAPAAGVLFALWIWRRFGLWYSFLAAMISVVFLPGFWTSSHAAQHVLVALLYAAGLIALALLRPAYRATFLNDALSLAEAFLWFGLYLVINLRLSSLSGLARWRPGLQPAAEFSMPFYWTTWVLIWCLPPLVLARGIRQKDRPVIVAGLIAAILTLVANKPYLGWPRHTWDPMLFGALLIGVALFLRRWLAAGPGGVRRGFTAERLSGNDKRWMNAGSTALGLLSPHAPAPEPQVRFGGGDSAGGGATSDF